MDMNKILQWMDLAKKYQTNDFWNGIFEQPSFDEFIKSNLDFAQEGESKSAPRQEKNFPPTDICLTDEEVRLIADVPGFVKEDIQLSVSGTKLLIKGSKEIMMTGEVIQQERFSGDFQRIIQLPEPPIPNSIRAKVSNGQLIVSYKRQFPNVEQVPIE
ncbi:Hsp20/alpha crystallin family protein [Bacillus sp. USDA818B3_A]|uniref:Hsp20/alpha crystallin family protein n=1 Tax=Bacillus sp. USDA818B3_A TaxID=2698834 RepID=UPI001368AD6A|nr:Hsp20/alpha crystallin family protein [Bacillus sp. USDA818B3_A]